jgi:hypothetical protein
MMPLGTDSPAQVCGIDGGGTGNIACLSRLRPHLLLAATPSLSFIRRRLDMLGVVKRGSGPISSFNRATSEATIVHHECYYCKGLGKSCYRSNRLGQLNECAGQQNL